MLLSLSLQNFVLAEKLEIEFGKGFGVLTGETGAGKSLLFDALQCVTGRRAELSLIREGSNKAEICATFSIPKNINVFNSINSLFQMWAISTDEQEILLRRVIEINGRSKSFINGSQVTLAQLDEIGSLLLDIHGQHDSLLLMRPAIQRELLDEFANAGELATNVGLAFQNWQKLLNEINNARENQTLISQQKELLTIRIEDLKSIKSANEWEELNSQHNRLAHLKSLQENAGTLLMLLDENDPSLEGSFKSALQTLTIMKNIDSSLIDIYELLFSAQNETREATRALRHYLETLEADPETLADIEEGVKRQLDMARKYKTRPELLADIQIQSLAELEKISENMDLSTLEKKCQNYEHEYLRLAQQLSKIREKAAKELAVSVNKNLPTLGMKEAKFFVNINSCQPALGGMENIEFQVSGLAGNTLKPLIKVASGGELSRLSLALYLAAKSSEDKVYLFDEIDAGIGGAVAEAVGKMLRELSGQNSEGQILGVTHLPQVAVCANWQAVVEKSFSKADDKLIAKSTVRVLADKNARIEEIARMLGGEKITEATRNHAREMLVNFER